MATVTPQDLFVNESHKSEAVQLTAQRVDSGPVKLSFDPTVGEKAVTQCKTALLLLLPSQVGFPNCDAIQAAGVAFALAETIESPRCKSSYEQVPATLLGDATVDNLRTYAQALVYLETRVRSKEATSNEIRVDPNLVNEGIALRERMLKVLAYHCDHDPVMRVELANIRSGQGYIDLASDLGRLATHYFTHRAAISVDKVHYVATDEDRASDISNKIVTALHTAADTSLTDLRNRAWEKTLRTYSKLKAAMDFIFADSPFDLATFPSLRHAVMQSMPRAKTGAGATEPSTDDTAPIAPVSPIAAPVAPPLGTGPGGNPLI